MAFDLVKSLESIAPTLATMLGGPMIGGAVTALESAFGLTPGAGTDGITQVIQGGGMTPEIISAVARLIRSIQRSWPSRVSTWPR